MRFVTKIALTRLDADLPKIDNRCLNVTAPGDSNPSTTYENIRSHFPDTPMVTLLDPDAARLAAFERWLPEWMKIHAPR